MQRGRDDRHIFVREVTWALRRAKNGSEGQRNTISYNKEATTFVRVIRPKFLPQTDRFSTKTPQNQFAERGYAKSLAASAPSDIREYRERVRWPYPQRSLDSLVSIVMSSSPFAFLSGKNGSSRGGFSNGARKLPATPAEDLIVVVDASRVVKVLLPFNTARAPAIRQFAQSYLVDDQNRRVLIFRKDMEGGPAWTNIALDATAYEPKLTMAPYELCVLVETKMAMCPDIARVIFRSVSGTVITLADINTSTSKSRHRRHSASGHHDVGTPRDPGPSSGDPT